MSTTMTYEEIEALEPDSWLNKPVGGKIGKLFEKQGKKGSFFTGNIFIEGQKCDLTIFKPNGGDFEQSEVVIAGKGNKRGEYNGTIKIVVSEKATIKRVGESDEPTQSTQTATQPQPRKHSVNPRAVVNQLANTYILCYNAGLYAKAELENNHGEVMPPDQFQALVSSLYIQATRENVHHSLPVGSFDWGTKKHQESDDDDNVPY